MCIYVCGCVWVEVSCRSQFSASIMWVQESKLGVSGLATNTEPFVGPFLLKFFSSSFWILVLRKFHLVLLQVYFCYLTAFFDFISSPSPFSLGLREVPMLSNIRAECGVLCSNFIFVLISEASSLPMCMPWINYSCCPILNYSPLLSS